MTAPGERSGPVGAEVEELRCPELDQGLQGYINRFGMCRTGVGNLHPPTSLVYYDPNWQGHLNMEPLLVRVLQFADFRVKRVRLGGACARNSSNPSPQTHQVVMVLGSGFRISGETESQQ